MPKTRNPSRLSRLASFLRGGTARSAPATAASPDAMPEDVAAPAGAGPLLSPDAFVAQCHAYKARLAEATSFEELQQLWRSSSFAYGMTEADPFSAAYRAEVLAIYEGLVAGSYDVSNELTSSHLTEAEFALGFPWSSRNIGVVASELGKAVHGFRALAAHMPQAKSVIEFGVGWGNTALPLARAGLDTCAVDIDAAFLRRIENEAQLLGTRVECIHADFVDAARGLERRYDVVLFSSSFHHCLEFESLLVAIRDNVLTPEGCILFFAEPISNGQVFPWGLRYDGEAVWAITCNKWLELGFREDFFRLLMQRTGFTIESVPDVAGIHGPGWVARRM